MDSTLLDKLAAMPEFTHGLGCADEAIDELERLGGGRLPILYRQFLERFGCAIWDGNSLYGQYALGSLLPKSYNLDAGRQTLFARTRGVPRCFCDVADSGLVISKYEGGGFDFLHLDESANGEVSRFEFGVDDGATERWTSVAAYIREMVEQS